MCLRTPPHCLKKNLVRCLRHARKISRTHSTSIGRAPHPDSPPTVTHWISVKSIPPREPIRGSHERNRRAAGTFLKSSTRDKTRESSTLTPIQTFAGQSILG